MENQDTKNTNVPEKKDKVISGNVKVKKRNGCQEIANNIKDYAVKDILIPSLKKAISDIIKNGIDMILYGETKPKKTDGFHASYQQYYKGSNIRYSDSSSRTGYDYSDIVLDERSDAEDVLNRLEECISAYEIVSVADLYDLVGISSSYTDNKYGWKDLRSARIVATRDGYLLKLPKARPLD